MGCITDKLQNLTLQVQQLKIKQLSNEQTTSYEHRGRRPLDKDDTLQDVSTHKSITATKATGTNTIMATTQTTNTIRAAPKQGHPKGARLS